MTTSFEYYINQSTQPLSLPNSYPTFEAMPSVAELTNTSTLSLRQSKNLFKSIHRAYGRHNVFNVDVLNACLHLLEEGHSFRQIINWTKKRWVYVNYQRSLANKAPF